MCVRDVCVLSLFSNYVRTDSCPFRNYCFWTLCGFTGRHRVHICPSLLPPYSVGSGFSNHEKPLSSGRSYEAWGLGAIVFFLSLLRALTWRERGRQREGEIGDTVASHYWWDLRFIKCAGTELVTMEPLLLEAVQVPGSPWSQHFTNWSSFNLVWLVFLLKVPYLIYIVD